MRVLIIEDHQLVRRGLKQILNQEYRTITFGEARTAAEGSALLEGEKWDLILLDLRLPDKDGFTFLDFARHHRPDFPVLVVSTYADTFYATRSRAMGAAGFVCKSAGCAELVKAINAVLAHQSWFNTSPADVSANSMPLHARLSQRELKVMTLIAAGKRLVDIAEELQLSVKTISTYKHRVLTKMGLRSAADLVRYTIDNPSLD